MKTILTSSAFVLVATLGVASMQAAADNFVGGDETIVNDLVPAAGVWTVLVAEPMTLADVNTHCVATGSADALNPNAGSDNQYRFILSIDNANPPITTAGGACERTVEFDAHGAFSQNMEEVSSTCTFRDLGQGFHTIYWLARKNVGGAPNLIVDDSSLSFACQSNLYDLDGVKDGS